MVGGTREEAGGCSGPEGDTCLLPAQQASAGPSHCLLLLPWLEAFSPSVPGLHPSPHTACLSTPSLSPLRAPQAQNKSLSVCASVSAHSRSLFLQNSK